MAGSSQHPATQTLPPGRRWMFRVVAGGASLAVCGLVVWMVLAWWRDRPIYLQERGHEKSGHRYLFDSQLGWRNIPGWTAETFGQPLRINSHGLRGREYEFDKPAGKRRILVLGDSYAWGYGVANQDVFTEVLEQRLTQWQVLNTAVSGWGTDQQLLYFEDEGVKYDPDIVVVAFFIGNDPENNSSALQYGFHKPVFLNADLNLANSPVPRPGSPELVYPRKTRAEQLAITLAILKRLKSVCDDRGTRLIVMKFGAFLYDGNEIFARFQADFEEGYREQLADVPYLDLDEALKRRATTDQILHGNRDGHWNPLGHRLTADALQQFLQALGWTR